MRRDHFGLLQARVERSGGRVVKTLGDGIMAVFGSASAALDCAVSVQRGVARGDARLSVRVGLAAGDVMVEDGDCFGAPVVEGARLCAFAQGGQILATEMVGLLASDRSRFELSAAELQVLKGLPEPVPVVEVGWSGGGASARGSAPLLERAPDLERIAEAFEAAADGAGRVVILEGPAGIGKTALLAAADSGAARTLRARGAQLEQDYAWGVVRQLFEGWLGGLPRAERARVLAGAAEPARAALGEAGVADEQPFAAVHGLYWLAMNAAEHRPLALVVDDVHWCDDASLTVARVSRPAYRGGAAVAGAGRPAAGSRAPIATRCSRSTTSRACRS